MIPHITNAETKKTKMVIAMENLFLMAWVEEVIFISILYLPITRETKIIYIPWTKKMEKVINIYLLDLFNTYKLYK